MKKHLETFIFLILILLIFTFIFTSKLVLSKQLNSYSYTKAICNQNNYCEDYVIECDKGKLKTFTPTGFSIQKNQNWIDQREPEDLCK